MVKDLVQDDWEANRFPYAPVALDLVSVLVNFNRGQTDPEGQHRDLPIAPKSASHVAIVVDGLGSSSAGSFIADLAQWIKNDTDFEVCVFSYKGMASRRYEPEDTIKTKFDTLIEYMDEYVEAYANVECLVMVAYSLGGLIVSEWLFRHRDEIKQQQKEEWESTTPVPKHGFAGTCLIASPIRLTSTRIRYRTEARRNEHITELLEGYTADPEDLPAIAPMVLLRCENDRLLDDSVYTFEDRPPDDRPVEVVIQNVRHQTIPMAASLRPELIEAISKMCLSKNHLF